MSRPLLLACTLLSGSVAVAEDAMAPRVVFDAIRAARLDPQRAVELRNIELDLGLGTFTITAGHLLPALPIAGQVREAVFIGQGSFRIEPPDAVEGRQLEVFTGARTLDTPLTRAVFVIGSPEVAKHLLGRASGAPPAAEHRQQAEELFASWIGGAERAGFDADTAMWKAAAGDPAYHEYFAALIDSENHGRFYYVIDPAELEQITLGQFKPLELDELEQHQAARWIHREQKRGRSIQLRLEHVGHWDTWLRSSMRDAQGRPHPGSVGFEPLRYRLDVTIKPEEQKISARATIDLDVSHSGRRGLTFGLFPDLVPAAVRDGNGRELAWLRSGYELHVLLPEPTVAKAPLTVTVDYGGVLLEKIERGIFALRDTDSWYPRIGTFDRATYDVTLRCPKGLGLLASGRVVESSSDRELRIERRLLELPAMGFTFEVGSFEIHEEQVGHVKLTVGFSKSTLVADGGVKDDMLSVLRGALAAYERDFGAYPLDFLTVATIPREFSQGYLSFLTLSQYVLGWRSSFGGEDRRDLAIRDTVAHELAHQWWGNQVGWYNYRDQWLSEALASYSAMSYVVSESERPSVRLARRAVEWRHSLFQEANDGRSVVSLGPVVMGERLRSSKSEAAYQAVVYDKGSLVFSMLARMLGDEELPRMLGTLASAVNNRAVDTKVFLDSLERMSGVDLDAFAQRFIYGTEVPEIHYEYRIEQAAEGGWLVRGTARSISQANYRCKLVRTARETWDVLRRRGDAAGRADVGLVVPFQITLEEGDEAGTKRDQARTGFATARGFGGELVLDGPSTSFSIPLREQPAAFWLDQRGEVLARFFNETRAPKRVLLFRAMELEAAEAAPLLEQALEAPLVSEQAREEEGWSEREARKRAAIEDARVHLELARTQLDRGQEDAAQESLQAAEKLLGGLDAERYRPLRDQLASRIAVRAGDYKAAWARLEGKLQLRLPRGDSLGSEVRRRKWMEAASGEGEDYALLAVTAFETGNEEIARVAAEQAEQRGADLAELRKVLPRE